MNSFVLGKLEIKPEESPNQVKFNWLGSSENRELISSLESYYSKLMEELKSKTVVLDFRNLKAMNLSTVPAIIDWIKKYGENGISVKVLYDKNSNWQKTSFRLLGTISANLKNVTVEALES